MKIKKYSAPTILPTNAPKPVLVDRKWRNLLNKIGWRWLPSMRLIRGSVKGKRWLMHKYIATKLAKKPWDEVFFENGDRFDMRLVNLRPYDRSFDGATRKVFKGRKRKGVYFNRSTLHWYALLKFRNKLHYLGTFKSADGAARAYLDARKQILANKSFGSVPKLFGDK